jgi:hypothetical protein
VTLHTGEVRHCLTAILPLEGVGKKCGVEGCKAAATHAVEITLLGILVSVRVPACNEHALRMVT